MTRQSSPPAPRRRARSRSIRGFFAGRPRSWRDAPGSAVARGGSAIVFAFAVLSCLPAVGCAEPATPPIDQRPELEVGAYRVSRYLFDKYFQRFADGLRARQHRPVSAAETEAWLDLFVAQQIIIAHEESAGLAARPEVVATVAHMERNMLTQVTGPFYAALLDREPPLTEAGLKALYEKAACAIEGVVARFPDGPGAEKLLGADFDGISTGEQTQRIMQCRDREGVGLADNAFSWPFLPFSEIGEVIESAPIGRWIRHHEPDFGEYFILVRNRKTRPGGDWSEARNGFRSWVMQMRQLILRQQRQVRLLKAAGFSFDPSAAGPLLDHCRDFMTGRCEIPVIPGQALADRPLFSCRMGAEVKRIMVEEFRRHYNDQYVRTPLREMSDLRRQAEDMALEELDYRAARAGGFDRTPRFAEDRFGFAGFQVLDLFERETLAPEINVGQAEIERYYRGHESEFRHTTRICGRLVEFETLEKASNWRARLERAGGAAPLPQVVPAGNRKVEVARDEPIPGLEPLQPLLFESPEGTTIGPIPLGKSAVCFVKERNIAVAPDLIEDVAPVIRGLLMRQALDSQELKIAADLSKEMGVRIDRSDFLRRAGDAGKAILP